MVQVLLSIFQFAFILLFAQEQDDKYVLYRSHLKENKLGSKDRPQFKGVPNHQQECKGLRRQNKHFLHVGLPQYNKAHNIRT